MLAFRDCLHEDLVILDVGSQDGDESTQRSNRWLWRSWSTSYGMGPCTSRTGSALRTLTNHLNRRRCVEADDGLKALKEKEREAARGGEERKGEGEELIWGGPWAWARTASRFPKFPFRRSRSRNISVFDEFDWGGQVEQVPQITR